VISEPLLNSELRFPNPISISQRSFRIKAILSSLAEIDPVYASFSAEDLLEMRGTALGSLTGDIVFGSQAELRGTLALNCGGNPRYQTIVTDTRNSSPRLIELVDCSEA
jgi:hypothetical protein